VSKKSKKNRLPLKEKLWKSILGVSAFYGIVAGTGNKLSTNASVFIFSGLVVIVLYWHIIERVQDQVERMKKYFIDLQKDIKFLKKEISTKSTRGKK